MQFVEKHKHLECKVRGICCETSAEQAETIWPIISAAFAVLLICFHRMGKIIYF